MDLIEASPIDGWMTPESAYIHVPFCRHRCGYCNFSVVANRDELIERYLIALEKELRTLQRPTLRTLFVGGGTPTHLSDSDTDKLFQVILNHFDLDSSTEFSVEANPEDINANRLHQLKDFGVNRISLGVQSFHPKKLQVLERGHSKRTAIDAILLSASLIPNVSLDLIFGAPEETTAQWEADLRTALSLPIQHLSTYALTYEKGTRFWNQLNRGTLTKTDEQDEVEMYETTIRLCEENQFHHYEVSNFCKTGANCRHNMAYWNGEGWFAAGPGAARFVEGVREVNHRSTSTYLRRMEQNLSPKAESESISLIQYAKERAAFGVRLIDGFDLDLITQQVGFDVTALCSEAIEKSIQDQLVTFQNGQIQLTKKGILFADTVASRLLS